MAILLGAGREDAPRVLVVAPVALADRDVVPSIRTVEVMSGEDILDAPDLHGHFVGWVKPREQYRVFGRSGFWIRIGHERPIGWAIDVRLAPIEE